MTSHSSILQVSRMAGDVILCPLLLGVGEDLVGGRRIRSAPPSGRSRLVGYPGRLLHIVGHDHDSVSSFNSRSSSSILAVEIGSSAEQGSSISRISGSPPAPGRCTAAAAGRRTARWRDLCSRSFTSSHSPAPARPFFRRFQPGLFDC